MTSPFDAYRNRPTPGARLADAAVSLGLPVFPCAADKRPVTEHGFHDASTEPATIRRLFALPGAALIGMPTGEATGIIVLDVDRKENRQGGDWLDANSSRMVQTRTIRTGSGGLHLYFRHPGQRVRNSNDKIAPGIDVRGDGGYVIVCPSAGYSLADDAPVADVPAWLLPAICPPEPVHVPQPMRRIASDGSPYGLAALQDECDAIRRAGWGNQESTLNSASLKIGGLIAGGELPSSAAQDLVSAGRAMSNQPGRPRWTDRDISEKVRRGIAAGMPRSATPHDDLPQAGAGIIAKAHAMAAKPPKALPVAPGLMDCGGALGAFVTYCNRTAISPQPFLALAAGICGIGALAGRRYRTRTNLRTNIYAVGIADSGAGKDHARKKWKNVLATAGLTRYLGGEDIASGPAVLAALQRHPAVLFQIDEFGDWLSGVLGKNAPLHKRQVAERFKTLYSSADSFVSGTEYANQKGKDGRAKEDIMQPHACLYGTTTPGQFWSAIEAGSMHDGLLARMLMFVSPVSYPDEADPDDMDAPPELIETLQEIAAGPGGEVGNLSGLMSASANPEPHLVPASADAEVAIRALRREQLAMQRRAEGTYVTAIAARWAENAVKLALVRAVSDNPGAPSITVQDVAWGRAVAKHCIDTLLQDAERHVADNEYERRINRAMDLIRKHGPITQRDLIRRGFKHQERDRVEILKTLVDSGMVLATHEAPGSAGGRPTIRYQVAVIPTQGGENDSSDCGTT